MTTTSSVSLVNAVEKDSTQVSPERTLTAKSRRSLKKWRPSSVTHSSSSPTRTPSSPDSRRVKERCSIEPSFFSST